MPASPAISATVGVGDAPRSACRRDSSAVRPTITGDVPVRVTSTRASVGGPRPGVARVSAGGALVLVRHRGGPDREVVHRGDRRRGRRAACGPTGPTCGLDPAVTGGLLVELPLAIGDE